MLALGEIEASLRLVQRDFQQINRSLATPRDPLEDDVIENLMSGYAYVDELVGCGVDILSMGNSQHLLELNALVLCGSSTEARADQQAQLQATEQRFYDQEDGGIGDLMAWHDAHKGESGWMRAAGAYVRILSEPQLFIEGNHRTGALIMSCLLARCDEPPFVLTIDNARAYFDPSAVIKNTRKTSVRALFRIPHLKKQFAAFLKAHAEDRFLLRPPERALGSA